MRGFYLQRQLFLFIFEVTSVLAGFLPLECEAVMVGDPWQFSLFEMSPVV